MWRHLLISQPQPFYILNFNLKRWKSKKSKNFSTPHSPRDPPDDYNPTALNHTAFEIPDFISPACFRPFKNPYEPLGPNATKEAAYKNPEFFAYHRYSFADLTITIAQELQKRIDDRGVQTMYPADEGSDSDSDGADNSGSNSDSESDIDSLAS